MMSNQIIRKYTVLNMSFRNYPSETVTKIQKVSLSLKSLNKLLNKLCFGIGNKTKKFT
jgi:hypothetical protein